jgi:hypothetical protein
MRERERAMSEVIAFHPKVSPLFTFYEVVDAQGIAEWGGSDPVEAVKWLRRSPINSRLLVSAWDAEDEEAMLVGQPVDITKIVFATLAGVL